MDLAKKVKKRFPSPMKDALRPLYWKMYALYKIPRKGIFTSILIETYGYCNRKCRFCFNNDYFPNREQGIMPTDIWEGIIEELSSMNFAGRISPHFYGEPLLDKRLPEFISFAREKCPSAEILFASNGDLLTEEILCELVKMGLDSVLVTNYDDFEKPNLVELSRKYPAHVRYRNSKDMWIFNRAGAQMVERSGNFRAVPCLRPSRQLVINWKGNIVLCCNDYYEKHVFGNVKDDSIQEVWYNDKFSEFRKILRQGDRAKIDICENCDTT